jgi:RNA polymerase sigma-70 factor (ECF subfamily)
VAEGLTNDEVAELYRRYGAFLRRRCLTLLRSTPLAEDALQDTFLKLMNGGSAFRAADHPMRWLYRVADRACFDSLRRNKHARRSDPIDDVELPCHPGTAPELRHAAMQVLAALEDEDQRIAVMAFVDGMSQQEIADELGYSRTTIVNRVAHIRERAERTTRAPRIGKELHP